jgi:Tfp pilus assembly protein PilZ
MGVGTNKPTQALEQRRSPRHKKRLEVELIEGKRKRTLHTVDVSRHGLFILTDDPPRERFLLQLSIKMPSGPLPATAFVARRVAADGSRPAGVGVQFFALSAQSKERWDTFIFELSGITPPPSTGDLAQRKPDVATFLIKLKDVARLREFYERNISRGGLYMATPVIKEAGAEVGLVVIHPETEHEYFLTGTVERVCTDAPKGMEIKLSLSPDRKQHFLEFVLSGIGPEELEGMDLRDQIEHLPFAPQKVESDDISVDIFVDEEALEGSEQFLWEEISQNSGVLTFDIAVDEQEADTDDLLEKKKAEQVPEIDLVPPPRRGSSILDEVPIDVLPPEVEGTSDLGTTDLSSVDLPHPRARPGTVVPRETAELYELLAEPLPVRVLCRACDASFGVADLGTVGGPLGLLASRHAFWCKYEDQIVSVVRLNDAKERRMMLSHLGEAASRQPITIREAFQIADLSEAPRCPRCDGEVRADGIPKAVSLVIDEIRGGGAPELNVPCPACRRAELIATLVDQ